MIKFEYLRFKGRLDDIRVFNTYSDNVEVIMKVDDVLIPNFRMPTKIYEEVDSGKEYEFYGLVQKSRNKVKNKGFVFAVKPENGKVIEVPSLRYTAQLGIWANGAVISAVVFVLAWIAFFFGLGSIVDGYHYSSVNGFAEYAGDVTRCAFILACLLAAFFVGVGINLFYKTTVLETWKSISPEMLVERFSKLHR
ncbi:hypothetical protein Q6A49_00130 [Pseudomonas sp. 22-AL-CL-001]|uniref:hypothetical protein n=1 Tax=Pseudomonas alabamensis TaxID=3064349 RepID=UPI002713304D|nr:hypothetical protein [Pseudomonas sp. 22-AL-CL-001]MDO7908954.1 hypothetical protein [Pseudomonas sp. 22-AL-CL-001]